MKLLNWIGEHPFLTVVLLFVIFTMFVDIIRATTWCLHGP